MPKIRSDRYDAKRTKSDGEKLILRILSESKEIDDWIVLHSLDILHNEYRTQGEADFVILAPGYGILVIEVKDSKSVERLDSGDWKIGGEIPKRGSPFKQASESMWNIRNYLDKKKISTQGVPFFHAVWFTKELASKFGESIEWKQEQILGVEHLAQNPVEALKVRLEALAKQSKQTYSSIESLTQIADALRPVVPLSANPVDRQKLLEMHLKAAIEQQSKLYTLFKSVPAYVVTGLAGTGKTYLAIAEAQGAHLRGEPTLFLCYNSLLAKELKNKLLEFPYVKVTTIHALMSEIADEKPTDEQAEDFWNSDLPLKAIEAAKNNSDLHKFETIIIDEAQDLGQAKFLDFIEEMMSFGLENSKVRLYGDFENQGIFSSGEKALDIYKQRISHLVVPDSLTVNCRNTEQVGEFVADLTNLNPGYSGFLRSDALTGVKMNVLEANTDPRDILIKALEIEKKLYPASSIIVLSSQKEKLKTLLQSIPGNFREIDAKTDTAVSYGTIQKFKGLEASSVILVEFEGWSGSARDHFYIAATRATANFTFIVPTSVLNEIT